MNQPAPPQNLRPLRRSLSVEALEAIRASPVPVHLMLVDDSGPIERGNTVCNGGLGEWITGDSKQVTCQACLEQVHT